MPRTRRSAVLAMRSIVQFSDALQSRGPSLQAERVARFWVPARALRVRDTQAHAALTVTRNPSRGFGIGHICQSGL
ncbi:protein of unknown function [Bradyrhizobium vignae]|uniref:Uncharacterized protein n=1 Tax=Bradyrhizobium vignae TaxID=1549949 RepID=A0A2U3QDB5_9BRAD|nr:protein of unknown function [Bradyrhizobium vignae]